VSVETSERERRARALDRLAEDLLESLAPLSFRVARTPAEIDATFRMRRDCVVEMGWAPPEEMPDGRERDDHDAAAIHIVCIDGETLAGCVRIVPPAPGRPLPTERDFGLRIEPPGAAAEGGRAIVAPGHRARSGHLVMAGLFARGWLETRRLGLDRLVGTATDQMIRLYRALGIEVTVLGPARPHWGEERRPVELAGAEDLVRVALRRHAEEEGRPGEEPEDDPAPEPALTAPLTRRRLLAHAGGVAAGALLVVGVPEAMAQRPVGAGPTDRRTIDFLATVDQVGRALTAHGTLTRVAGLGPAALFTRPPGVSSNDPAAADPSSARLTIVTRSTLAAISVMGSSITGHGTGTAEIHLLPGGGARLDDPASFGRGTAVAAFRLTFQHNLALDNPNRAAASFTADLTQRSARAFTLGGRRVQIGRPGLPWSMRATGRGERLEPTTPVSKIFVSGDMGVIDAVARR
jgi:N-acyl-L-homoserine lactone synthetase